MELPITVKFPSYVFYRYLLNTRYYYSIQCTNVLYFTKVSILCVLQIIVQFASTHSIRL